MRGNAMKNFLAFITGIREFRLSCTTRNDSHDVRIAYDWGREWAHRLTFRHYDH